MSEIETVAQELVQRLASSGTRIVFAESCTGGMIAAELAKIPGVSDWLCGSAVTYRCDTKVHWLGVDAAQINQHTAVSAEVAGQMVAGVLQRTPEASIAASITGHFGPDAPGGFDGLVFVGVARRGGKTDVSRHQLSTRTRKERQVEAARWVMQRVLAEL